MGSNWENTQTSWNLAQDPQAPWALLASTLKCGWWQWLRQEAWEDEKLSVQHLERELMEDFFMLGLFLTLSHMEMEMYWRMNGVGMSMNPLPLISEATTGHLTNCRSRSQANPTWICTCISLLSPRSRVIYCFCFLFIKGILVYGNASNNTKCKTRTFPLLFYFILNYNLCFRALHNM